MARFREHWRQVMSYWRLVLVEAFGTFGRHVAISLLVTVIGGASAWLLAMGLSTQFPQFGVVVENVQLALLLAAVSAIAYYVFLVLLVAPQRIWWAQKEKEIRATMALRDQITDLKLHQEDERGALLLRLDAALYRLKVAHALERVRKHRRFIISKMEEAIELIRTVPENGRLDRVMMNLESLRDWGPDHYEDGLVPDRPVTQDQRDGVRLIKIASPDAFVFTDTWLHGENGIDELGKLIWRYEQQELRLDNILRETNPIRRFRRADLDLPPIPAGQAAAVEEAARADHLNRRERLRQATIRRPVDRK